MADFVGFHVIEEETFTASLSPLKPHRTASELITLILRAAGKSTFRQDPTSLGIKGSADQKQQGNDKKLVGSP